MKLIWHQREDGLWNAACSCNATVVGIRFEQRADAEAAHFEITERAFRAKNVKNQIPPCGPKLPEPNPNFTGPLVFP